MSGDILAIDVGTSALKVGVFGPDLEQRSEARRTYTPHIYDRGKADFEPESLVGGTARMLRGAWRPAWPGSASSRCPSPRPG